MAFGANNVGPNKRTGFTFRGREITLSKTQGAPFRGLKAKGVEKGIFPEEKRIEAVTLYAATGNFEITSELSGVPEHTIRAWRRTEWFQELLREVRHENNEKLDAKFSEIVEKSLEQLVDRVENGDFHVLRDGALIRKPINAKDLSLVAAINVDKRQLLRGEPTSRSESVGSVEEKAVGRLERLAETFENLAKFGRQPKVIEIETVREPQQIEDASGPTDAPAEEGHPEGQVP